LLNNLNYYCKNTVLNFVFSKTIPYFKLILNVSGDENLLIVKKIGSVGIAGKSDKGTKSDIGTSISFRRPQKNLNMKFLQFYCHF